MRESRFSCGFSNSIHPENIFRLKDLPQLKCEPLRGAGEYRHTKSDLVLRVLGTDLEVKSFQAFRKNDRLSIF